MLASVSYPIIFLSLKSIRQNTTIPQEQQIEVFDYLHNKFENRNKMQTIQVKISDSDFQRYQFNNSEIKFTDLVDKISLEFARQSLLECNAIAEKVGLSNMTLEEIDAEIKAVRDAKANS